MRSALALGLAVAGLSLSGCVDIEQTLTLDQKLGGKAGLSFAIDFDPMVRMLATMKRTFEGKEGPPTEADMAVAREEFLKNRKKEKGGMPDPEKLRADLSKNLPPG